MRARLRPAEACGAAPRRRDSAVPVCYVLEQTQPRRFRDAAALCACANACRVRGRRLLPTAAASAPIRAGAQRRVSGARGWIAARRSCCCGLIEALRADPSAGCQSGPAVGLYWGRAPQKERSVIRLLLSEDWVIGSRLRRFFSVLVNGRNSTGTAGRAGVAASPGSTATPIRRSAGRRVARPLRLQFARLRAARIGPDLSHRRTIVAEVLRTRAVRAAVAQEVAKKSRPRAREALLEARRYADEIAANYSHVLRDLHVARAFAPRFGTASTTAIEFTHLDTLQQVAEGNEIVYVPCHRSHMDYLLLSYAIYQHGFAIPHIAAGVNLNLPIVGRFLRKGGAFFIRRSLRGNALYTIVFIEVPGGDHGARPLDRILHRGRTQPHRPAAAADDRHALDDGAQLPARAAPAGGVPAGVLRLRAHPGGPTYIGELSGQPKEKETVWACCARCTRLRQRFGRVHVNLGEPIFLRRAARSARAGLAPLQLSTDQNRPRWVDAPGG